MARSETRLVSSTERGKWGRTLSEISGLRLRGACALREEFLRLRASRRPALFISERAEDLRALADVTGEQRGNLRLLLLEDMPGLVGREFLQTLFRTVVAPNAQIRFLEGAELVEALSSDERDDLFIAGSTDRTYDVVVLYRGNLDRLAIPFAWFERKCGREQPDFERFSVVDHGQTVRLGEFKASTDAILYEFDLRYRRKAKRREIAHDASFGASVRRLRLQRDLSQDDFHPLSKREIGRIERGEVTAPRAETLAILAARLGVAVKELGRF